MAMTLFAASDETPMNEQTNNRTTISELRRNAIAALAMLLVISAGALIVSHFL
jgi:hypothetical protein